MLFCLILCYDCLVVARTDWPFISQDLRRRFSNFPFDMDIINIRIVDGLQPVLPQTS